MRYKFRYYNGTFKLLKSIVVPLQNLLLPQIFALVILRVLALIGLGQYLNNDTAIGIIQKIILACSILWMVIYCVLKKGVFIYDEHLVIARYTITFRNWKNRIVLRYDEIESVNVNYNDLRFSQYHGSLLVPFGDNAYNVEITMKKRQEIFFQY